MEITATDGTYRGTQRCTPIVPFSTALLPYDRPHPDGARIAHHARKYQQRICIRLAASPPPITMQSNDSEAATTILQQGR